MKDECKHGSDPSSLPLFPLEPSRRKQQEELIICVTRPKSGFVIDFPDVRAFKNPLSFSPWVFLWPYCGKRYELVLRCSSSKIHFPYLLFVLLWSEGLGRRNAHPLTFPRLPSLSLPLPLIRRRTHLKLENHLTSCAVLFLLNLMSGKYILRMAEDGYRVQKNISFALRRCIGVSVELAASDSE